jgi:hypothetical protein
MKLGPTDIYVKMVSRYVKTDLAIVWFNLAYPAGHGTENKILFKGQNDPIRVRTDSLSKRMASPHDTDQF